MILFYLFLSLEIENKIDSLKALLNERPQLQTILELNSSYIAIDDFDEGITLLRQYENRFGSGGKPVFILAIGDDYFFAGKIVTAHAEYLKLVKHDPRSEYANDALERLYLIESARKDTMLLKKFAYAICLFQTDRLQAAEDSLKNVLKTKVGAYAYYYLALVYMKREDVPLALGALQELADVFPDHTIHYADLLLAEILLQSNNENRARQILEELIIDEPTSIYAARARELLKEIPNP